MKLPGTKVIQVRGWLAWLLAIPVLVVAAVFGFFVFLAVLGLALVAVAAVLARLWWLRRRKRGSAPAPVIEGEYRTVRDVQRDVTNRRR